MSTFRRASTERVNAFHVGDRFLCKHYFEEDELFGELKRYYDESAYRFEIPEEDFPAIVEMLENHGYGLVAVDELAEFVVVVEKYTHHPSNVFEDSVAHTAKPGYNVFLMKDQASFEQALNNGAETLTTVDVAVPW